MWRKQSEFEQAHTPEPKPAVTPDAAPEAEAAPESATASSDATPNQLQEQIVEQLKTIFDPEIPVNIYELGLIYEVAVDDDRKAKIKMTLTTPMCPAAEELPPEVETKARGVAGVTGVELDLVWEPPWNPDMMSEAAKLELGMV